MKVQSRGVKILSGVAAEIVVPVSCQPTREEAAVEVVVVVAVVVEERDRTERVDESNSLHPVLVLIRYAVCLSLKDILPPESCRWALQVIRSDITCSLGYLETMNAWKILLCAFQQTHQSICRSCATSFES